MLLINHILDVFCGFSSQRISQAKIHIFFSNNVDTHVKRSIVQVADFQVTNEVGKYLRVPILHEKVDMRSFQIILDKVDQRLNNTKA